MVRELNAAHVINVSGSARQQINNSPEPVTVVGLAPQTNLALLLALYPDVLRNVERVVFMGGSASVGNITAVAKFNVCQDPRPRPA